MKNTLSPNDPIDKRLNELIRKKSSICTYDPRAEQTKDLYFQELKAILIRYNMKKLASYLYENQFIKSYRSKNN